jgi:hypothetical protein
MSIMQYTGNLLKMRTELHNPVQYYLTLDHQEILMNDFIGKQVEINYLNEINCIGCGAKTIKSFAQGYCYKCLISRPETEECVLNPELCRAHEGHARDMAYAEKNCLSPHYVYLAVSSDLKVGVTRQMQIPTRWIDQGASRAIKLAETPYRALAGDIEVELKQYFNDKTAWQKMLKGLEDKTINLLEAKQRAYEYLPEELAVYVTEDDEITEINYPMPQFPTKVSSLSLDKQAQISGILTGIKGQYLVFDNSKVFNVRKHNGYKIELSA